MEDHGGCLHACVAPPWLWGLRRFLQFMAIEVPKYIELWRLDLHGRWGLLSWRWNSLYCHGGIFFCFWKIIDIFGRTLSWVHFKNNACLFFLWALGLILINALKICEWAWLKKMNPHSLKQSNTHIKF